MQEIIEKMTEMISRNPAILKTLSAKSFCITIEIDDKKYTISMNQNSKNPIKCEENISQKSDITAKLSKETYQAILNDELSWIDAYVYGELKIDADPTPFTDLARILELARPLYTKHINIASQNSEMEEELEAKLHHE